MTLTKLLRGYHQSGEGSVRAPRVRGRCIGEEYVKQFSTCSLGRSRTHCIEHSGWPVFSKQAFIILEIYVSIGDLHVKAISRVGTSRLSPDSYQFSACSFFHVFPASHCRSPLKDPTLSNIRQAAIPFRRISLIWLTWFSFAPATYYHGEGAMLIAYLTSPGWLSDHREFGNSTVAISLSLRITVPPFNISFIDLILTPFWFPMGPRRYRHGRDPVLYRLSNDTVPKCTRIVDLQRSGHLSEACRVVVNTPGHRKAWIGCVNRPAS